MYIFSARAWRPAVVARLARTLGRMKANMSTFPSSLQLALIIFGWTTLCYALPREYMRRSAGQHYREWVGTRAYWGRHYDKWIIGDRVFYTDEFWGDIIFCLVAGPVINLAYFLIIDKLGSEYTSLPFESETLQLQTILGTSITTSLLLIATRVYDRCYLPDEEVARREAIEPGFKGGLEMKRLLDEKPNYIRRIIGKHASETNWSGD